MSQSIREEDIMLEPCDVFWGKRPQGTITCVADVSDSLNGKYFDVTFLNEFGVEVPYRVWINTNSGTAPAAAGKTLLAVTSATNATAAQVATAVATALDGLAYVRSASSATALVTFEAEFFGELPLLVNGDAGFTMVDDFVVGFGGKLGATQGGVEVSLEIGAVDITADQTGEQVLDAVMNANNASVSMNILEMTRDRWSLLVGKVSGDELTPVSGTKVVGLGESKRFKNMKQYAGELILKPVGAVNNLRNHYFWKASPTFESINFSGADLQQAPFTFRCFRDTTKDQKINIWTFGDGTQDLSA